MISILKTKNLSPEQHQSIHELWNQEYPKKLKNRYSLLLKDIKEYTHHLLLNDREIIGWAVEFEREGGRWFSLIVSANQQGKGYGKMLLRSLMNTKTKLSGWVIDHNNDLKSNGDFYRSPLSYYLRQGFKVVPDVKLDTEMIKAVKVQWQQDW